MSLIPAFEVGVWNAWVFMIWLLIQNYGIKFLNKEIYQKAGGSSDIEPSQAYKIIGYVSVTLWLLTTLYSIFLPLKLGTIWFYIGLIVFLIGMSINIIATINFVSTPIKELVIKGIYRYSRHPMYLAMLLIYLSVGIASASWIFLLVSVVWLVLIGLGVKDEEKVLPGRDETMCSPIVQAEILNDAGCDLNILMGLCVGHDSLFFKHAKAFTTVFVVKDRLLGHNPIAALYQSSVYYRRLLAEEPKTSFLAPSGEADSTVFHDIARGL